MSLLVSQWQLKELYQHILVASFCYKEALDVHRKSVRINGHSLMGKGIYTSRFPHRFRLLTMNLLNELKARTVLKIFKWAGNFLVKVRRNYKFLWVGRKLVAVFWIRQFWVIYLEKKNSNCNNRILSSSSWWSKTLSSWMFMGYTPLWKSNENYRSSSQKNEHIQKFIY